MNVNVALEGYKPLAVVSIMSNHMGSCPIMGFSLTDSTLTAVVANHEFNNKGTWPTLTVTATVLYVKILT